MRKALEYLVPSPEIIIGKSIITTRIVVGTAARVIIDNNRGPNAYAIKMSNAATVLYIGGQGVTIQSGFPVDSSKIFTLGMLENTKLYGVSETDIEVYILDMGI